eukprot:CAMPEP_0202883926 /NCGR_PEP_ID=MMETSP1391-20130828/40188_1 /ASSEMBLY_ACC=CAM_ASM_000867 /TAXON_ID=1034604 /ORGANISM="Chlamydomonas leiostraca, Strain SAG 11-49" /LENGTH=288 /DNA_ID=CAMNT_0049567025 /DNA_START=44 /DNA_END=907 /DNA_ORIENTATION=-
MDVGMQSIKVDMKAAENAPDKPVVGTTGSTFLQPDVGNSDTDGVKGAPFGGPAPANVESEVSASWPRRMWHSLQTYGKNVRKRPLIMLGPPIIIFCICVALGVWGVEAGAKQWERDERGRVQSTGIEWAASFKLSLDKTFTPLSTLSIFIKRKHNWTTFSTEFPLIMQEMLPTIDAGTIQELQVAPLGHVDAIYQIVPWPTSPPGTIDIFANPALRGGALTTIEQKRLVINGPLKLVGGAYFGAIVRIPIFIQNTTYEETFGTKYRPPVPTNCTGMPCWNEATKEKFW